MLGKPDTIVVVESKLTKIDHFRKILRDKFDVQPKLQRLFYGGKLLENGYTFHDYNIKLNDVIQLMVKINTDSPKKSLTKSTADDKTDSDNNKNHEQESSDAVYTDAVSKLYAVGDLVDVRDPEHGAWFESKIIRIVHDQKGKKSEHEKEKGSDTSSSYQSQNYDCNDLENKPPIEMNGDCKPKSKGIAKYFTKSPKGKKKDKDSKSETRIVDNLLYKVQLDNDEDDSESYCKEKDIRPRARTIIDIKDLKVGQTVMVNYNIEEPMEKGYWFDFKVSEIRKLRTSYDLVGTLYLGPEAVPQNDTKIRLQDKIFAIEEVVPLEKRSDEYNRLMTMNPEKRSQPLTCLTCRDDEEALCKDCGCYVCLGKEFPEKIVLCDECNYGYHMSCLKPPLKDLPDEDWYCPSCKRDPQDVVAPGAAKQTKKKNASQSKRDWGRGMACVGKTKTCAMPANHFGPIPGIEVGMCWRFRIQLSESGVHRPPVSGIHGRDVEGAYSIVLSGGYEDDVDNGNEFTYTGSGGRDLSGNKRTAEQSCDQTLTRENKALARNCAVNQIKEDGADAGENWKNGKPVRVVRSYKMMKHFPKYAPSEGIRYDGIYKVVKYYPEKGLSGYRVWKYLLRRDDPSPAPWEAGAKHYPIVYPDGYLEAEAEKKALKQKQNTKSKGKVTKKRALRESNQSAESECDISPPAKKRKTASENKRKGKSSKTKSTTSPNGSILEMFSPKRRNSANGMKQVKKSESVLTSEERDAIKADTLNSKLWGECLAVCDSWGKKEFVEFVSMQFLCIICQEVAASPVTTPCLHNFCMACLKLAFKTTGAICPCCRQNLAKYEPEPNEELKTALRSIMTGYDAGKK